MFAVEDSQQDDLLDAVVTDDDQDDSVKDTESQMMDSQTQDELSKPKKKKKRIKYKAKKLVLNVSETKYHVVRYVAKNLFNMRLSAYSQSNKDCYDEKHEWDILWTDNGVTVDRLYKMKPY